MKPITSSYSLPKICIFVTVIDNKKTVDVVHVNNISRDRMTVFSGYRLFSNFPENLPEDIAYSGYNIDSLRSSNAVFPYTEENYKKLCDMTLADYMVYLNKNLPYYPSYEELQGAPVITRVIHDSFTHLCNVYPVGDLIEMNYDERYESIIDYVWEECMRKINWESFCRNPEDESEDFMDFQQSTMGNIGAVVMELMEARIRNKIAEFYKGNYMKEERKKLVETLTR